LALALLEQEGLIEIGEDDLPRRLRATETLVVQLGDLDNCVQGSINSDLQAARLVGPFIDLMLIGNHEHPYFGGPRFDGFAHYQELKEAILKINDRGMMQAALEVDGILLTHAGVTRDIDQVDKWHGGGENKAREVAAGLNILWRNKHYRHGMFSCIGRARGGQHEYGSVLWADWREEKSLLFPQIFGHTVAKTWRAEGPINGGPSFPLIRPYDGATPMQVQTLCIDIGVGKRATNILGCWIIDGEVRLVEYQE
jgi:hypothetical protein